MLALIGTLMYAWSYFSKDSSVRRQLRNAARFTISELPDGKPGRIVGRAAPLTAPLVGPFTGRPCVYYVARLEELRYEGHHAYWGLVCEESLGMPFAVDDGTGRAIVDPTSARISLDMDARSYSDSFAQASDAQRIFLARHGQSHKGWVRDREFRYYEAIIAIGETVAVLGSGVREPDPDAPPTAAYPSQAATRVRLIGTPEHPVEISDAPETFQAVPPATTSSP